MKFTRRLHKKGGMIGSTDENILIEDYLNGEILGKGSQGLVVKSQKKNSNKYYAIKIIDLNSSIPNIVKRKTNYAMYEINILRFLQSNCNHYVMCFDTFIPSANKLYIVSEYLEGYTELSHFMKNGIPDNNIIQIIHECCSAIIYLHSIKVAHCDLKPSNIMIQPDTMKIKLIDFGVSYKAEYVQDNVDIGFVTYPYKQLYVGTTNYIDPLLLKYHNMRENEQTQYQVFDTFKCADLFSFGIVIFMLISNKIPCQLLYENKVCRFSKPDFLYNFYTIELPKIFVDLNNPNNKPFKDIIDKNNELFDNAKQQNLYSAHITNLLDTNNNGYDRQIF